MYNYSKFTLMKKKYYLWSLLTIVMMVMMNVGFTSCSNDDEEENGTGGGSSNSEFVNNLQGTWQFQKGTETVMGMTVTVDRSMLSSIKSSMEEMLGSRVELWDETLIFSGSKLNGVSYKLEGNKLILEGMDAMEGINIYVKSVTSSTLILHEEISLEGIDLVADMEYSKQ